MFHVRRERRWSSAGKSRPGNWFAPPGSNRSGSRSDEAAETSGEEGRYGDLASMQAMALGRALVLIYFWAQYTTGATTT